MFLRAWLWHLFCCRLFAPVIFRLFSFDSMHCCAGLLRLLLGSEVTLVCVGIMCDEPNGNKLMAHSQIVVVISLSLTFEMDVALVVHGRPLGNAGFHCYLSIAIYHYLFLFVSVRFCLF